MDAEGARAYLLSLPHVVETMQWGENLVFWAGDKAIGGKMFALMDLTLSRGLVLSFAAGPEGAAELCEREGFVRAPYLGRLHWVAAEGWDALSGREWKERLSAAHQIVYGKLPAKVTATLALPAKERALRIAEGRAARETTASARKTAVKRKPTK